MRRKGLAVACVFALCLWASPLHAYLAKVNGEEITAEDFMEYLKGVHFQALMRGEEGKGGKLNEEVLHEVLDRLIDQYLMAQEARRLGLHKGDEFRWRMEKVRRELAGRMLWMEEFEKIQEPSREELWNFYKNRVEGVRVRQIFTTDRQKAEEALRRLQSGQDFSQVAKELSEGPFARVGGRVGVIRRGQMPKKWEEVVFSMKEGETSGIIQTPDGFYIVRVEGMKKASQERFEKGLEGIKRRFLREKRKEIRQRLLEQLREKAHIEIDREALEELNLQTPSKQVLARVNGEEITAGEVLPVFRAKTFGYEARKRRWNLEYDEDEVKEEALQGLIDEHLISQEAIKRGYFEKDPQLRRALHRYEIGILAELFRQKLISPQIRLKSGEIEAFYHEHVNLFYSPPAYHLRVIEVRSREEAVRLRNEISAGADFAYLAREASLHRSKRRGGDIGWVSENRLPEEVKKALSAISVGEVTQPLPQNGHYVIYKLEDVKPGSPRPLEEVKEEIKRELWRRKFSELLRLYLEKLHKLSKIKVDEKALKRLQEEFNI
ncbi:MAG: hypothetical protein DRG33_00035 [Deltaproteobacteria bacterium]|nr:MAG: hypothetical protein DRG33_00035 [Deltaproteobacteria bacterium]